MPAHDLGLVTLFRISGPDALRYLNGQITQDARKVIGTGNSLPGCLLDAKGRVQFRVWIFDEGTGNLLVYGQTTLPDKLEARLGKYLIADDAEIISLGERRLIHVTDGETISAPLGCAATRFGAPGTDLLLDPAAPLPVGISTVSADETEDARIRAAIPGEAEFSVPVFPQEAGLEASDISFHKGCYTGQEVISRIKRAGKVNKHLAVLFLADGETPADARVTSISPLAVDGVRPALAYVKRGTTM